MQLSVLAQLGGFDIVPQLLAILPAFGRAVGQQDFGVHDAGLIGEVVGTIEPLVVQPRGAER